MPGARWPKRPLSTRRQQRGPQPVGQKHPAISWLQPHPVPGQQPSIGQLLDQRSVLADKVVSESVAQSGNIDSGRGTQGQRHRLPKQLGGIELL